MQQQVVQLTVLTQNQANTADPVNQLYEFTVQCHNIGAETYQISNNMFYVVDSQGSSHFVERAKRATRLSLAPGATQALDRIYIAVPRDRKATELHLSTLGSCRLK